MSSDEKDPDNDRYYYSIKPYWRNERVTHWLHDLDRIHSQKYSTESEPSTCRIPSGKVDMDCGAVGGLPLNFYDRCYLNNLETPQYKSLNSQPPIPLGFCPSIERYALTLCEFTRVSHQVTAFWTGTREQLPAAPRVLPRHACCS